MAHIPAGVLARQPVLPGLKLRNRGKVRDSYNLPGFPEYMLVVVSDRISVYDFVLNALIPLKGAILNAMSVFWMTNILKEFKTDLVAYGAAIDHYLPENLRKNVDLQMRATVVRILPAPNVEAIVRGHITGSGWDSYVKTSEVCGHVLPAGLKKSQKLPEPLYTPTTKADVGHDEHIDHRTAEMFATPSLKAFKLAADYALTRGIILADTKFEWSGDVLVDEKLTPDSSRFWPVTGHEEVVARGTEPPSFDKESVRQLMGWIKTEKLKPTNPEHVAKVDEAEVPEVGIRETTMRYRYAFWRLTGKKVEKFFREDMGINIADPRPNVQVIIGSESDKPQCVEGLRYLAQHADVQVNVISCHRNPKELKDFLMALPEGTTHLLMGAGKSAQLPGVGKGWLGAFERSDLPVLGVAFVGSLPNDDDAAISAIECLPDQPVELDPTGEAFFGTSGFKEACVSIICNEFFPRKFKPKPAKIGLSVEEFLAPAA